ncbi:MAG: hypothetical protein WC827_00300 [Candidatus Paceibacterota bacterium]|jgi:hypothetical protein
MTTEKRELVTTSIDDGPSLHSVLTSLSITLPSLGSSGGNSPFGFPVIFKILLQPIKGWEKSTTAIAISVVITGIENIEYNYSDYFLSGYFDKESRLTLCSLFKLPVDVIKKGNVDICGWLTFKARYNVHKRKGEFIIEYLEKKPWFVGRNCKRFD